MSELALGAVTPVVSHLTKLKGIAGSRVMTVKHVGKVTYEGWKDSTNAMVSELQEITALFRVGVYFKG